MKVTNQAGFSLYGITTGGSSDILETTLEDEYEAEVTFPAGYDCETDITLTYWDERDGEAYELVSFYIDICVVEHIIIYNDYFVINGETMYYE